MNSNVPQVCLELENDEYSEWNSNEARAKVASFLQLPAMVEVALRLGLAEKKNDLNFGERRKATKRLLDAANFLKQTEVKFKANIDLKHEDVILRAYVAGTKNSIFLMRWGSDNVEKISGGNLDGAFLPLESLSLEIDNEENHEGSVCQHDVVLIRAMDQTMYNAFELHKCAEDVENNALDNDNE
jgi:hypothetical protein